MPRQHHTSDRPEFNSSAVLCVALQEFVELPDGPLVVVGDDKVCRMCLVNDAKSWVRDMDAKGLGPCPRAAACCCNCHM
jgi:hypothetical protein